MRNVDDNRAAEGSPDEGTEVAYTPAMTRRARRRKQAMIGVVGLVSLLGAGAAVATQVLDDSGAAPTSGAGALQPVVPAAPSATSGAAPRVSAEPTTSAGAGTSPTAKAATATPRPKTTAERIAAVRSLAAKPNNQVRRPPAPTGAAAAVTVNAADVTTTELKQNGENIRVRSARQDLTGYNELGLVGDAGTKYGDARCTNKIRVRDGEKPRARSTFLLCWRTSATKSVFTVTVKFDGRPTPSLSVAALNNEWAKLG